VGRWTPSAGLLAPDSGITLARPVVTTTYVLFASDSSGSGTCASVRDTVHIAVEIPFIHPHPENQEFCPGEILTVGVSSVSAFSYVWSPVTGLNNPYVSSTTVAPLTPMVYTLAVTSDTMISENCKTQYFPVALTTDGCIQQNVVTPNGDGINDYLNFGSFNGPITLSIYDRWGALIFSSNAYTNNWPQMGSQLPETVYWYVVKVATEGGKPYVGEVMILR
jgi:gliding motility-associated-like protein